MVGFWVQRIGVMVKSPETQMLQPMHSRMSSSRPSSIFFGRKGSAMEGRAAPMKSRMPRLIWETMLSGEVKRPTPTTGLEVSRLTKAVKGSCEPSALKREVVESFDQRAEIDVPEIGQLGQQGHHVATLGVAGDSAIAQQFVGGEAHRDGAGIAHRLLRLLDDLAEQAHPVFEAAAIFVDPVVAPALQEMHRQRQIVAGVAVDDVETGLPGAQRRLAMPAPIRRGYPACPWRAPAPGNRCSPAGAMGPMGAMRL